MFNSRYCAFPPTFLLKWRGYRVAFNSSKYFLLPSSYTFLDQKVWRSLLCRGFLLDLKDGRWALKAARPTGIDALPRKIVRGRGRAWLYSYSTGYFSRLKDANFKLLVMAKCWCCGLVCLCRYPHDLLCSFFPILSLVQKADVTTH